MYRDRVTSYLNEDARIHASVLAMRRIFKHPAYQIYLCIYSGFLDNSPMHADLVTALVTLEEEKIRIMAKLWIDEITGDRNGYFTTALQKLRRDGITPFSLIRDVKIWGHVPLTQQDKIRIQEAGVSLPPG